ncbi:MULTISPECIES: hypothetical protein [unclassified Streptomyces]|uniref:hypothetical protein n=1 Tax=unclassified Streptomyces TaxID=2593676 RepID=UPI000DB8FD7B|nr:MULTISPECIES: hypothetical protein [Streptomyces]MYU05519.1 hypothetical protein [Streptomyces sp. SID8366]MYU63571.1 hypothetical protein [Streptomyces sp. SID69]RAJ66406.1 hypothetical protein K376_00674 [Streptomyces sp. PsTaAH-130]TXJ86733.1 hypothetical protein E2C11_01850 [Streptomyces lavendulae]
MRNSSRTAAATGAAALLAVGLLVAGSATATAAPAKADRITSVEQLRASIQQAAAAEREAGGGALGDGTVGRAAVAPC